MRYYYEMNDSVLKQLTDLNGKYLTTTADGYRVNKRNLLWYADRVWRDDNGCIEFIKNRFKAEKGLSCDELEEFVWVKLRCKHV